MKKKVKKIPKFKEGTPNVFQRIGSGFKNIETDDLLAGISGAGSALAGGLGIEQTKFSQTVEGLAPLLDMAVPGLGTGAKTFAQFVGGGGSTDGFGNAQKATGLTRWLGFGRSDDSVMKQANMEKGSILAKQFTENLKADYMNQGINPAPNVLAAEGGIVPGEHYASRGEVEVAADGTNAVRYGWDPKGKDTYHVYTNPDGSSAVGNIVFTEEGVKRPNGEKYSDAAEKIIKGTKEGSKLRQISLRKLANEMEEQKMGKEIKKLKQGIPAHEDSKNPYVPSNMGSNTWWTYVKNLADQFGESVEQFLNRAKLRGEDLAKFGSTGLIPYVNPTTGTVSFALPWGSKYIDGSTRADDTIINEKVAAPVVKDGQTVVVPQVNEKTTNVVDKNIAKVSPKKEIAKKEIPVKKLDKSVGVLETPDLSKQYSRADTYNPNLVQLGKDPFKKLEEKLFEPVQPIESELTTSNYSNPGWQDWLYRTALLTQPLWDIAKAEPVQYEIPNAKYVPTGVDVSDQLRDVSEGYALAKYNFANLYPNTGAGMAAGLQAASTAAKQRADIHQYKTDAQNKLIGANVGIYNNWANRRAEILNDMYNRAAANRASARNINRQNRAAALSNYGQMLRDDKQYAMDTLKLDALTPLIMYGTENSDTLIKKARQILNK